MALPDEGLRPYCTERQWEVMSAIAEHGSIRAASKALGRDYKTIHNQHKSVLAKAARQGYSPEHDMRRTVPDGFHLKGTSTLYNRDGEEVLQWVKSNIDHTRQMEIFREAVEAMADDLPRAKPTKAPKLVLDHLASVYPVGDHHFGMLAWREETGSDYDLDIGERLLTSAMDSLVASSPASGTGVLVLLGDFLHYDSFETVTPTSKHQLDSDSRFPKMVRAAIKSVRYMVRAMLTRHAKVHVVVEIGNHDLSSSIFLMECLFNLYENEPRVSVDRSPSHFHYWRFGKCLVGVHHGHGAKMDKLPLIMATDRAKDWGETEYRYWYTGHVHHDQQKDYAGVRCESFRILPPADAWAANNGYRAGRDMKCIVLHQQYGEVARHIVNPAMLDAA